MQAQTPEVSAEKATTPDEQRLVSVELLKKIHRDLDACQKVIWLAGCRPQVPSGFDPSYVTDAQERLKEIEALLEEQATAQDEQYPPCDFCGVIPDHHPWHGSGMFKGFDSPHIHACNDCRHLLPSRPAHTEQQATVKDCLTVQPMAYAVFAANGNAVCFSTRRDHPSLVALEKEGHSVVSLAPIAQTAPQPVSSALADLAGDRFEAPVAGWSAPAQDERKTFEAWAKTQGDKWLIVGGLQWSAGTDDYASARTNAAWAAWQERAALSARPAQTEQQPAYVECRECTGCGHVGINDAHPTDATCAMCDWSGPSPVEDQCPDCGKENAMGAACPKCSGRYRILAETHVAAPIAQTAPQTEQSGLVEALRRIARLPIDPCSTENDYRLAGAKAIAEGVLPAQGGE
ncbi:hypothetical protein [Stutzerimonas stutzeri]|uniref:Uncharacterized protein n=1 Tax=Stutzerimonas stutzeri KOS6 TaxID=1218352 RepID=A0A061JPQ7_STUST|nr:hypothetical protein [Stutzerimonas stutzeri]EWC40174.1 hypothetical protein B597_016490 [Stutzerimonas stutzeri KOS6]